MDRLYFFLTGLTLFFTFSIFAAIFYFMIKYRRRSEKECPPETEESKVLEITWIVIPGLICVVIFLWGASLFFAAARPPRGSTEIFVVGKQWMWKLQHPEGAREINQLHIPVGVPVRLTMTSEDVIHDFFVPAFRIKMDVVPGRYTSEWFQATKTGSYHLFCAQYCGMLHSGMTGTIEVMSPTDYAQWLRDNSGNKSMAESGQELFARLSCDTCHVTDGTGSGPALQGRFGKASHAARWPDPHDGRRIRAAIHSQSRVAAFAELSPGDAHFSGANQRRADSAIDRLHQVDRFGKDSSAMSTAVAEVPVESRINYLNASYGIKSWLFTTDHKRIALLYLGSITLMFFIGGAAAVLMRLHLIEPAGALVQPETYNKLFTMHGVIMVFFFLIPSIPATLGNFLVPMMIGARDLAFPRLNLLSWYIYITGADIHALCADFRRGRYRLDVLHPIEQPLCRPPT